MGYGDEQDLFFEELRALHISKAYGHMLYGNK